jgi:pimeloyl-ACP methyl ester carboxylesterase
MSAEFQSLAIGARRLRYVCAGEGRPAVVVDQGQGLSIERSFAPAVRAGWGKVFGEIAQSTRIFMHDRAGLGSSGPAPGPRTCLDMVDDLRGVLAAARIAAPYVLVGHSIGGFNVRVFAGRYPDEVGGMVLVDSSHPDQLDTFAAMAPPEEPGESLPVKILRQGPPPGLTPEAIDLRACAAQARAVTTIGPKPLVVVSQNPVALAPPGIPVPLWERMRPAWSRMQADLLGLSAWSTQRIATHAGHLVQLEEPELVIQAILDVLRDSQQGARRLQ